MEQKFRDPLPAQVLPPVAGYPQGGHRTAVCHACSYQGQVLQQHSGYRWWMFLFVLLGLIGLIVMLILANQTKKVCPNCRQQALSYWGGAPTEENARIFNAAYEEDRRAFRRNKLIVLAAVLVMLGAVLAFVMMTTSF